MRKILDSIFEEIPEEKERYDKLSNMGKFFYRTGVLILETRKWYVDNVFPDWYKNNVRGF